MTIISAICGFFRSGSSLRFPPAGDQMAEFPNLDFLETRFVRPTMERAGGLWLVVLGRKHVERVEDGPFPQLAPVEAVHRIVVGDRQQPACDLSDTGNAACTAVEPEKQGHAAFDGLEETLLR